MGLFSELFDAFSTLVEDIKDTGEGFVGALADAFDSDDSDETDENDNERSGQTEYMRDVPIRLIANRLSNKIFNSGLSEENKVMHLKSILDFTVRDINILTVGATGSGKSSTINALFDKEVAPVGVTPNPETMKIEQFELGHLILWDSPGIGDNVEIDKRHGKELIKKLREKTDDDEQLINIVLIIVDASSKDLGSIYWLLKNIIFPNVSDTEKVIIGLNQSDMAMKGHYWNAKLNQPEEILLDFLEKRAKSIKRRIRESTGQNLDVVYYAAGYKNPGEPQGKAYNISKLLYSLLAVFPKSPGEGDSLSKEENEILKTLEEMIVSTGKMDQAINKLTII